MKKILIIILTTVITMEGYSAMIPAIHYNVAGNSKAAYLSLEIFFKSYDTSVLKRLKKTVIVPDEPARLSDADIMYMQGKNAQLIPLLAAINPVAYNPAEMSVSDDMLVYAGLFELYAELQGNKQGTGRAGFPWACIRDVILSAFNVSTIIVQFQGMIGSGASWSTVRPFLWQSLRKYGGWFTVAGVIWDIATECF